MKNYRLWKYLAEYPAIVLHNTVNSQFKKVHFFFLKFFDLRKIYAVNVTTGRPKKISYVGDFATRDLS